MFSVKLWFILVNHIAEPMSFSANPISFSLKLNFPILLEDDGLHELFLNDFCVVNPKAGNALSLANDLCYFQYIVQPTNQITVLL